MYGMVCRPVLSKFSRSKTRYVAVSRCGGGWRSAQVCRVKPEKTKELYHSALARFSQFEKRSRRWTC